MGAWGAGLFDDDEASDVRDLYRTLQKFGVGGEEAVTILMEQFGIDGQSLIEPVFWLSLAELLWRDGMLPEWVKLAALRILERNTGLGAPVGDSKWLKQSARKFEQLRTDLQTPQRPAKILPKRYVEVTDWEIGRIVSYKQAGGMLVLVRVIGHYTGLGGRSPVIEVLDWTGRNVPSEAVINGLSVLPTSNPSGWRFPDPRERDLHLALLKSRGRLPQDASYEEYLRYVREPLVTLVRKSENDRAFKKAEPIPIRVDPTRRYFPRLLANYWRPWDDLEWWLAEWFSDRYPRSVNGS